MNNLPFYFLAKKRGNFYRVFIRYDGEGLSIEDNRKIDSAMGRMNNIMPNDINKVIQCHLVDDNGMGTSFAYFGYPLLDKKEEVLTSLQEIFGDIGEAPKGFRY